MTPSDYRDSARYQEFADANAQSLQCLSSGLAHSCMAQIYDESTGATWDAYHTHGTPSRGSGLAERMARSRFFYELTERGRVEIEQGHSSSIEEIKRQLGDV